MKIIASLVKTSPAFISEVLFFIVRLLYLSANLRMHTVIRTTNMFANDNSGKGRAIKNIRNIRITAMTIREMILTNLFLISDIIAIVNKMFVIASRILFSNMKFFLSKNRILSNESTARNARSHVNKLLG